ncbi:putative cytochrome P450 [Lasiodiplodia theobromae]|uniref:putative cytochrome P450 n=1 Tax=Lasiodiplodia theobromae TaxID=45133 RepID=UPI0015C3EA50|nr:putative cytochrome P450 [Lasiodiplodia theobromae]KAF4545285.1 putative cytochrome P450 [Lasiodiplodia theobromae]
MPLPPATLLLLLTIFLITTLKPFLHRLLLHPLRTLTHLHRFPAATPLASLLPSSFYHTFLCPRRNSRTALLHAAHYHQQGHHHPILRTGPLSLSFSSPAAITAIYGHGSPQCAKGAIYAALAPQQSSPSHASVLHVVDRGAHAAKRRRLAHGFSLRKAEGSWEGKVGAKVGEVVAAFDNVGPEVLDFARWMNLFTVEAVADLVGSWRLGCLERGDDEVVVVGGGDEGSRRKVRYVESLRAGNRATARAVVWAPRLFRGVVRPVLWWGSGWYREQWREGEGYGDLVKMLVRERIERWRNGEVLDDMVRFLLEDGGGNPLDLYLEEIEVEVNTMLDAGSDTTAIALANVMYFLLKSPTCFTKLREELDRALPADTIIPSYDSIKQLPYLRACLDESLRIIPPVSAGLSRTVPPEGMTIDGHWIPGGTSVAVAAYTAHRNPSVFAQPEEYRPDRWLGQKTSEMQAAFIPFSTGSRGCIGRNITYLEQTVMIATLVQYIESQTHTDNYSGCATCRVRHIKCDEKKPICNNCEKRNLDCKQTEIIVPCLPPRSSTTVTKTLPPPPPPPPPIQPPPSPAPGSTWEVVQQSQSTFPPPAAPWPSTTPSSPTAAVATKQNDDCTTTTLLRIYQHGIGTWMDVMDHSHRYQRAVLRLALSSPLILHALCALAAKQMSLVSPHRHHYHASPSAAAAAPPPSLWEPLAARYYGESLRLLIAALAEDTTGSTEDSQGTRKKRRREETLTATILLGSYELLAAPSADYARHLRGAQTLIRAGGIDFGTASALEDAGLWVFARQDVAMAVAGRRGLLWEVGRWGEMRWNSGEGEGEVEGGGRVEKEEDWWGKKVLWLLARVVECVFGDGGGRGEEPVEGLVRELGEWYEGLPGSFEGLRLKGALAEGLDEVWFPIDTAGTVQSFFLFLRKALRIFLTTDYDVLT